jgi:hypothetical protein
LLSINFGVAIRVSGDHHFAAPHHTLRDPTPAAPGTQEKSPRHCCLGLNPPMEEVEETIGPVPDAANREGLVRRCMQSSVGPFMLRCNIVVVGI